MADPAGRAIPADRTAAPLDLSSPGALAALRGRHAAREPEVCAFLPEEERWPRLERELAALCERWPDPQRRPPLFALPVGVKDIFHVAGLPTRGGSSLPPEELAGEEGPAVARLRDAGALVVGKTVTTEFAYFAPGPTRNPRAPGRTPGGSSSGSAAAVAAGLCPLALGTQTIGSVCRPAGYCGVVGFKPSYDRVPRAGLIPLAPSVDHVGWLAADVLLAATAAAVLCDGWRGATGSAARPAVLAIPEGPYLERATADARVPLEAVATRLSAAGWRVRRVAAMADFAAIEARHRLLVAAEAAAVHAQWFARHGERYHAQTRALIERGRAATVDEVTQARSGRAALRRELEAVMAAEGIDLWLSPAAPGPPPPLEQGSTGDPVMNLPWSHAGLPAVTLPAGVDPGGLPFGLQLTGRGGADEQLLQWAAELAPLVGPPVDLA